jgi:uncharacterized membrane protein (UPF0182 family)
MDEVSVPRRIGCAAVGVIRRGKTAAYDGAGGIGVGGIARKGSLCLVLQLDSRILIRRRIQERLQEIAPFLHRMPTRRAPIFPMPELKRVIAAYGDHVVMKDMLAEPLAAIEPCSACR